MQPILIRNILYQVHFNITLISAVVDLFYREYEDQG